VGSLREELAPGRFVLPDQFIDRTTSREKSFFGAGVVAHVSMAEPTCPRLAGLAADAARAAGRRSAKAHVSRNGGSAILHQGGERIVPTMGLRHYRHDGDARSQIGARGGASYALVGMVTDYDCWREETAHVEVSQVIAQLGANAGLARKLVVELARLLPRSAAPRRSTRCWIRRCSATPSRAGAAALERLDAICAG
jgi:5'-methylthioadenosine phosphorylase